MADLTPRAQKSPVATRRFVENVFKLVIDGLFDRVFDKFHDRICALEQRIEQRRWCGVWAPGKYRAGNEVTHANARWHANRDTEARPGDDASAWTLCQKSETPPPRPATHPRSSR